MTYRWQGSDVECAGIPLNRALERRYMDHHIIQVRAKQQAVRPCSRLRGRYMGSWYEFTILLRR